MVFSTLSLEQVSSSFQTTKRHDQLVFGCQGRKAVASEQSGVGKACLCSVGSFGLALEILKLAFSALGEAKVALELEERTELGFEEYTKLELAFVALLV